MSKYYIQYNQNTQNEQHNASTTLDATTKITIASSAPSTITTTTTINSIDTKLINSGQYANNNYQQQMLSSSNDITTPTLTIKMEHVNTMPSNQLKMNSHLLDHGYGATPQPSYTGKVAGKSSDLTNYYKVHNFSVLFYKKKYYYAIFFFFL